MLKEPLALLLAATLCACKAASPVSLGPDMVHTNGLVAASPEGFDAEVTAGGFVFAEVGSLRAPREIRLALVPRPVDLVGPRSRIVDDERVPFVVRGGEGGSGGGEYELTAVRPMKAGYLVMTAFEQSETVPSFDAAWATLEYVTLE